MFFYLLVCQVRVTVGDSGLLSCLCDIFPALINCPTFVESVGYTTAFPGFKSLRDADRKLGQ